VVKPRDLLLETGAAVVAVGSSAWADRRRMGAMADDEAVVAEFHQIPTTALETRDLIRYATLAPNGHNTQPWRFRTVENGLAILPDFDRRTPVVDPDDHHVFVSLGCATENLAIAAGATGRAGDLAFDPSGGGKVLFRFGTANGASDLRLLAAAATIPGVDLVLITERPQMDRLRDLVIAGNTTQIGDTAFVTELKHWLRFSAASGNPALPEWMGPWLFDRVFTVKAETARDSAQIASSAGIAVFVGAEVDPASWMQVGRACQRFALFRPPTARGGTGMNPRRSVRGRIAGLLGVLLAGGAALIGWRFRSGHGLCCPAGKTMPADASAEQQADAFVCMLDAQNIQSAVVMGGSAGALSAMQMAIRHSERVLH
jgi:hypothetical protein